MIDGPPANALDTLRRCEMPPHEIRWLLTTDDAAVVHMLVELHVERLEEELAERQRVLGDLEVRLSGAALASDASLVR